MNYTTAFLLGFVGSLHCVGMCGPLALALPVHRPGGAGFVFGRQAYNLGRIITYCSLGLLFGLLGKTLWLAGFQRGLSLALGIALLVGLVASRRLVWYAPLVRFIASLKSQMSTLLQRSSLVSLASLGLLNGLLPCGLVYVACAGAAASGHVLGGMGYMLAFGLGTLPMMLTVSLSRRMVPASWRVGLRAAVPISVFVVAMLLILRGLSLGIPGLSPDMAQPGACCAP